MRLRLNISTCPNDTFMFDALINGRIDTQGFDFDVRYADIEELNRTVIDGGADVSKISYAVLPEIYDRYEVSDSGSALGFGNGPLLVARESLDMTQLGIRIAVPGRLTTANLLMGRLYPAVSDKTEMLFSEIAPAVASGRFDAGVLIHEGRFTYRDHGLVLLADLGAEWERTTSLPLPLGGIVISRSLPEEVRSAFENMLRESIRYAFGNPFAAEPFVRSHAQEMNEGVIRRHIKLFVNDYSVSLGDYGRRAVKELTGIALKAG